jgi:hypothetical protein
MQPAWLSRGIMGRLKHIGERHCSWATQTPDFAKIIDGNGEAGTVLPNWPSGSPYLDLTENIWGIIKPRVDEQGPNSLEQATTLVFRQSWREMKTCPILTDQENKPLHPPQFWKVDTHKNIPIYRNKYMKTF